MKKLFALILALVMLFSLGTVAFGDDEVKEDAPAEEAVERKLPTNEIKVLFTNDVHCGINDNLGYKTLATVKNAFISAGKDVILADAGDAVQGDTIGTLSKGEYIIDIMNALGYDVATLGNHEFDYGPDQLKALIEKANFEYVSCNFVDKDEKAVLKPYIIIEKAGVKIAFVGISTPKTLVSSSPANFRNEAGEYIYGFMQDDSGEKLYACVQEAVDAAIAEGADYVVALDHLGIELDCAPWTCGDVITHTTGIDVFIDGHSHSVIPCEEVKNADGKTVLQAQTGTKLDAVGCLTIGTDGSFKTELIDDGGLIDVIGEIEENYEKLVEEVVAKTDVELCINDPEAGVRIVRSQETNLGDLCADGYLALSGADIAFVNGGGVRDTIPAGDITYGQIIKVHPFGNSMCVIEVTGQDILDALELSASKLPGEYGGFLQVAGITYTIDMSVESTVKIDAESNFVSVDGDRRVKDVKVGDEDIDPEKTYTLAGHNFMLKEGGDGYSMFIGKKVLQDCVLIDNQVLINYIVDVLGGTVGEDYSDPYGQGRINIING